MRASASFLVAVCLALCARPVWAAQVYFGADRAEYGAGAVFEVGVFIGTDGQAVNAVEGTVQYPTDRLRVVDVRPVGSIVGPWIEAPRLDAAGTVRFAGIIPGGFLGDRGFLFSVVMEAVGTGDAPVSVADVRVLLHDGEGTPAEIRPAPFSLTVTEGGAQPTFLLPEDKDAPESFTLQEAQDPNLFDGRRFIAFETQDKATGIAHYEVWEHAPKNSVRYWFSQEQWRRVESPYALEDQSGRTAVSVRALDRAGNIRVSSVEALVAPSWYERVELWGILGPIILILGGGIVWRNKKRGRR